MPQCILLDTGKSMPQGIYKTQANLCPSVFVKHRQITVFVKRRRIDAPVYLLNTDKLMSQCIC